MWLHTEECNEAANALYQECGYEVHSERPMVPFADMLGLGRDRLYTKPLVPVGCNAGQVSKGVPAAPSVRGSMRASDKVFVWEKLSEES